MLCTRQTCTFVSVTFIAMLMTPIARLFNIADICKYKINNGDKFYRRKSMQAVNA